MITEKPTIENVLEEELNMEETQDIALENTSKESFL